MSVAVRFVALSKLFSGSVKSGSIKVGVSYDSDVFGAGFVLFDCSIERAIG